MKKHKTLKKEILLVVALFGGLQLFSQVTLTGTVKNTTDSVLVFQKSGANPNPIIRGAINKRFKAKIQKNGTFSITLPEDNISEWIIKFGDKGFQIFNLIKGQTLEIEADFSKESPLIAFGKNADEFNYSKYWFDVMIEKFYHNIDYNKTLSKINFDSTLILKKAEYDYGTDLLDKYFKKHSLSDKYRKWLKTRYKYEPYLSGHYRLSSADSLKYYTQLSLLSFNDDYAALEDYNYSSIVDNYLHYKFNGAVYPMGVLDYLEFIKNGNLVNGLTLQSCLARELVGLTTSPKWDTLYSKFLPSITNPTLLRHITKARNQYLISIGVVKSTEVIDANLSISEIFANYKGKVLYVDIWASWCGPCRGEMPNAAELREKLAGKDVVFIYLGYQDTKDNWLVARKDLEIQGVHYLLNSKQIKEADDLFEINSIPHYIIIDKEGRIVNKHAERPTEAYETLLKLLQLDNQASAVIPGSM